jgi:hypothetical protein
MEYDSTCHVYARQILASSGLCLLWHLNQVDRTNSLNSVLRRANFPHQPSVFRRNTALRDALRETQSWLFCVAMGLNLGTSEVKPGCPFLRQHSSPLLANSRSPNATSTLGAKLAKSDRPFPYLAVRQRPEGGVGLPHRSPGGPPPTEFFPTPSLPVIHV